MLPLDLISNGIKSWKYKHTKQAKPSLKFLLVGKMLTHSWKDVDSLMAEIHNLAIHGKNANKSKEDGENGNHNIDVYKIEKLQEKS